MMSLDIITVNLWQILISLANLVLIFLIVKKFLFKPVQKLIADRRNAIEHQYAAADEAERAARASREAWENKLQGAHAEADAIVKDATEAAKRRAEQIVGEADAKADGIVKRAHEEAVLERRKATEDMKHEIVEVSTAIAEKMLEREVSKDDHRALIGSFIDTIGEGYDRAE